MTPLANGRRMMVQSAISLKPFNTFGIEATAEHYAKVTSVEDVRQALAWAQEQKLPVFILGGGSNILFQENIHGLVIHMGLLGIDEEILDENRSLMTIAAGEDWSQTAWWAASHGFGGIENLYLIPGSAGAAAVQNIGAYGVELCDVCHHVTALNRATGEIHTLAAKDCQFGYRESLFKHQANQWIVLSVTLELNKKAPLKTSYGALQETLKERCQGAPCFTDVALAVASIRESKLPSPESIGSAGSFFKNPVVSPDCHASLIKQHPKMPAFALPSGDYKLSASWLLDTAGWKKKDSPTVACYPLQPLVITNKGGATGKEIVEFSQAIQQDIAQRFAISLEREVVIYPPL